MKIFIETLNRNCFPIYVRPEDKVADVKINIETVRGSDDYRAAQLMLIHQGKVLKDNTSLEENSVAENSYVVVMFTKVIPESAPILPVFDGLAGGQARNPMDIFPQSFPDMRLDAGGSPLYFVRNSPQGIPEPVPILPVFDRLAGGQARNPQDIFLQNQTFPDTRLDAGVSPLEFLRNSPQGIREPAPILPIFDRLAGGQARNPQDIFLQTFPDTRLDAGVNPLDFLPQGIPEPAPILSVFDRIASGQARNPQDIFPQGFPDMRSNAGIGPQDFLRNGPRPMLRELGMQNPDMMRRIQQHPADFLRLINEPVGGERNVTVTLEEREAIESLEAMGFDRALVLEMFFACNKNKESAANYLLHHMREFEN